MNEKNPDRFDAAKTTAKLSLAELLARSMEDEGVPETTEERERWDEDEGSSGG